MQKNERQMNIQKEKKDEEFILKFSGKLDSSNADELTDTLRHELKEINNLTFDFKDLDFISSKGIRVVLAAYKEVKQRGNFKIINANSSIKEIFRLSGLLDLVNLSQGNE